MKRFFRTFFHHKTLFADSSSKIGNTHVASHKPPILPKKLREGFAVLVLRNNPLLGLLYRQIPTSVGETYLLVQPNHHRLSATSHFCDLNPNNLQSPYMKTTVIVILNPKTQEITKISVSLTRDCIHIIHWFHRFTMVQPKFGPGPHQVAAPTRNPSARCHRRWPRDRRRRASSFLPRKKRGEVYGKSWEITQKSSFNGPLESGRKLNGPLFRDVWYVNPF